MHKHNNICHRRNPIPCEWQHFGWENNRKQPKQFKFVIQERSGVIYGEVSDD